MRTTSRQLERRLQIETLQSCRWRDAGVDADGSRTAGEQRMKPSSECCGSTFLANAGSGGRR